ncbi:MAG: flap endonuclease, partial [Acidimicrobiia bacterium]|nr:flap endonuclease [Acidimicrobiia bacterium]
SADDWDVQVRGAAKLAATLAERVEDAMLYRELTRLRTDVPLPESLADLEWRGVRRDEYLAMCEELGFEGETRDRPHRWQ